MRRGDSRPPAVDDLFEAAAAEVAKDDAGRFHRVLRELLRDLGEDAAGYEEEVGIAVVIEVGHAGAPAHVAGLDADAGRQGDVVEVSFAIAAVKDARVVGEVGLEYVEVAVEIVVADAEAHA